MSRIFWGTNLFVYLLEGQGEWTHRVVDLRRRMIDRGDELLTSTLTLGELLVKPEEVGDHALAVTYRTSIERSATVLAFSFEAALRFAEIRASDRSVKAPDAIQLACAAEAGTDLFITNDDRLSRKMVPGIQFVTGLGNALL